MNPTHFKAVVKSKLGKPFSDDLEVWEEWRGDDIQRFCCNIAFKLELFDLNTPPRGIVGLAIAFLPDTTLKESIQHAEAAGYALRRHLLQKTQNYLDAAIKDLDEKQRAEEKAFGGATVTGTLEETK